MTEQIEKTALSDPPSFEDAYVDDDDQELERAFDRAFRAVATPAPPPPMTPPTPKLAELEADGHDPWGAPSATFTRPDAIEMRVGARAPVELDPAAFADILHGEIIVADNKQRADARSSALREDPSMWRDDPALRWAVFPRPATSVRSSSVRSSSARAKQDRRAPRGGAPAYESLWRADARPGDELAVRSAYEPPHEEPVEPGEPVDPPAPPHQEPAALEPAALEPVAPPYEEPAALEPPPDGDDDDGWQGETIALDRQPREHAPAWSAEPAAVEPARDDAAWPAEPAAVEPARDDAAWPSESVVVDAAYDHAWPAGSSGVEPAPDDAAWPAEAAAAPAALEPPPREDAWQTAPVPREQPLDDSWFQAEAEPPREDAWQAEAEQAEPAALESPAHEAWPAEPPALDEALPPIAARGELEPSPEVGIEEAPRLAPAAEPRVDAQPAAEAAPARIGEVITVFGCRGGCGATTIAVNLAGSLAAAGKEVCIVDLDVQLGDVLVTLDLDVGNAASLVHLARDVHQLDPAMLKRRLARHESGVYVLAQGGRLEEIDDTLASKIPLLLAALARHFDTIIIDGVDDFSELALAAIDAANVIALVLTQDVLAVRRARRVIEICRQLEVPDTKIRPVLNCYRKRASVDRESVAAGLTLEVAATIADDERTTRRSQTAGQLLHEIARRKRVTRDVAALCALAGTHAPQPAVTGPEPEAAPAAGDRDVAMPGKLATADARS